MHSMPPQKVELYNCRWLFRCPNCESPVDALQDGKSLIAVEKPLTPFFHELYPENRTYDGGQPEPAVGSNLLILEDGFRAARLGKA